VLSLLEFMRQHYVVRIYVQEVQSQAQCRLLSLTVAWLGGGAADLSPIEIGPAADAARKRLYGRHAMRRLGKVCGGLLLGVVVTVMTLWGMGALYYSPLPTLLRQPLAIAFGLVTAGAFLALPHCRRTLLGFGLV